MSGTTPKWLIPYNQGTDQGLTIDDVGLAAATLLDDLLTPYDSGAFASRPVSTPGTPGIAGREYYAPDTGRMYKDLGTSWLETNAVDAFASWKDFGPRVRLNLNGGVNAPSGSFILLDSSGVGVVEGAAGSGLYVFYSDPAGDFAAAGRSVQVRIHAEVITNAVTAPGVNLTVGCGAISFGGVTGAQPIVAAGSIVQNNLFVNTPAANTRTLAVSAAVAALASSGWKAFYFGTSAATAANSHLIVMAKLQYRQV